MKFHGFFKGFHRIAAGLAMAGMVAAGPQAAFAQDDVAAVDTVEASVDAGEVTVDTGEATVDTGASAADATSAYTPMAPTEGKGMPIAKAWDVQDQFSPTGEYANGFHIGLIWVMAAICAFVLGLMLLTMWKFRAKANPVPSKTSHNTLIEVVWTVVPALILLGIAIPSITLIAKQYQTPPKDAITVKAIGYQWYWGYAYPDNGDFEIVSNMLTKEEADARGEPHQLAVDNRMVLPVGVPIRMQTTAADVIHSFAMPSLWFKLDAVPGRLNEKMLTINEPGVYYGQCSELCGARHGYMPITIEALPMDQFNAWVVAQGGTVKGAEAAAPQAETPAAEDAETAAETTDA